MNHYEGENEFIIYFSFAFCDTAHVAINVIMPLNVKKCKMKFTTTLRMMDGAGMAGSPIFSPFYFIFKNVKQVGNSLKIYSRRLYDVPSMISFEEIGCHVIHIMAE